MTEKQKTSPKDIFLQLLAIVTLYGSAVAFLTLLYQFINIKFPDTLDYYSSASAYNYIRFAVSSLVIVFPVYLWVIRFLEESYTKEPERKDIRIRKWLVNFTLFAAGLIIMGDLVALVNSFLGGELTARFVLKAFSVFLVSGAIFWYYYWDMKDTEPPGGMKFFSWVVMGAVCVGVVSAFFMVGSPQQERLRKFDNQRVGDLQTIQWQIVNYWQQKEKLPTSLDVLEDDISGFRVPRDPETSTVYAYTVKGGMMFELCADFSLPSSDGDAHKTTSYMPVPVGGEFGDNWTHETGRVCFERTIDPDLYPPREKADKSIPAKSF